MGPRQTITLDLSAVDFMDSACLVVLVQARGKLTADGGSLLLRNPSPVAHSILTITESISASSGMLHQRTRMRLNLSREANRLVGVPHVMATFARWNRAALSR